MGQRAWRTTTALGQAVLSAHGVYGLLATFVVLALGEIHGVWWWVPHLGWLAIPYLVGVLLYKSGRLTGDEGEALYCLETMDVTLPGKTPESLADFFWQCSDALAVGMTADDMARFLSGAYFTGRERAPGSAGAATTMLAKLVRCRVIEERVKGYRLSDIGTKVLTLMEDRPWRYHRRLTRWSLDQD